MGLKFTFNYLTLKKKCYDICIVLNAGAAVGGKVVELFNLRFFSHTSFVLDHLFGFYVTSKKKTLAKQNSTNITALLRQRSITIETKWFKIVKLTCKLSAKKVVIAQFNHFNTL